MPKKTLAMTLASVLSLGLVGALGGGVAWAHGGHGGSGSVPPGETHTGGGRNVGGDDPIVHGAHIEGGVEVHGGMNGGSGTNVEGGATAPDTNVKGGSKGHGRGKGRNKGPLVLTGSVTCSVHGKIAFKPALVNGGTASSTVTVTGLLNRCTNVRQGKVKFNNGHLSALMGTMTANDCAVLSSGVAPALSGGSIMWTPPSKVAPSSSISTPAGTGSVVTNGGRSVIQISYSGGSVGSGSFSNTGGLSVKVTSTQDSTQISGRCTTGLTNVAFSGTVTL